MTSTWFDSHCHVQEEFLGTEGGGGAGGGGGGDDGGIAAILGRAADAGVDRLVCIGTGVTTSRQALSVARGVTDIGCGDIAAWASIGLHPHEASEGADGVAQLLAEELAVGDGAVVAVGECGLDYYYEHSPRQAQRTAFAAQIALAHAHDLALVIHARDAWDDLFDVLSAEGVPERTVLHCFTGGPDEVDRCLRAGMFISFSGIVTFKNAADVRRRARRVPPRALIGGNRQPVPGAGAAQQPTQHTARMAARARPRPKAPPHRLPQRSTP